MTSPIHQNQAPAAPAPDCALPTSTTKVSQSSRAASADQDGSPCCVGIDVPGMGYVHDPHCPLARPIGALWSLERASEARRERLLCQLLFAAHGLAQSRMVLGRTGPLSGYCFECGGLADPSLEGAHEPICKTGRVMCILADLAAIPTLQSIRKEAATDGEKGQAGDGILSPGDFGEPWRIKVYPELDRTCFFDRDGSLLFSVFGCDSTAFKSVARILECVNANAGGAL